MKTQKEKIGRGVKAILMANELTEATSTYLAKLCNIADDFNVSRETLISVAGEVLIKASIEVDWEHAEVN